MITEFDQQLAPPIGTHEPFSEQSGMGLLLSNRYRVIGGVCGGIAEWLGWSPTLVRVLYMLLSLVSAAFPGLLVYIVLWILMPRGAR